MIESFKSKILLKLGTVKETKLSKLVDIVLPSDLNLISPLRLLSLERNIRLLKGIRVRVPKETN